MAIIGESGSGKSVLTKCIDGLLDYDSGFISYDKIRNIKELNSKKKCLHDKIWNSFQNAALFDSLTIEENLRFAKKIVIFRKS